MVNIKTVLAHFTETDFKELEKIKKEWGNKSWSMTILIGLVAANNQLHMKELINKMPLELQTLEQVYQALDKSKYTCPGCDGTGTHEEKGGKKGGIKNGI